MLDTRSAAAYRREHVKGAIRVDWKKFSMQNEPNRGQLLPKAKLQTKLRNIGIQKDRRVVVMGDPKAWGEEGRIVWMLRLAGHDKSAMVDGGFPALKKANAPVTREVPKPTASTFTIDWDASLMAEAKELLASDAPVVVDTRTKEEYDGATPYGESRGGHVPGAEWLYFKDLMGPDGMIRSKAEVEKLLQARGVSKDAETVLYCTGGVRSAWALVVLKHYGFDHVRNYAGSMWEWSAAEDPKRPLVTN